MSRLVLYDFPPPKYSKLNKLVKYLPYTMKNTYYQLRICCYQNNLELPNELWNEIIYQLCEPIEDQVLSYKVLDWYNKYIHDKRQHTLNPVLMSVSNNVDNSVENCYLCADVDIAYSLKPVMIEQYFNCAMIPVLSDLVVGIEKNWRIISIKFTVGGIPFKYMVDELYEYTLESVYSHSMNVITSTNTTLVAYNPDLNKLLAPQHLNNQNTKFWSVDIMPFSLVSAPYDTIYIDLEVIEPITEINLLYAYLKPEIRNDIVKNIICYKNITYSDGTLSVKN